MGKEFVWTKKRIVNIQQFLFFCVDEPSFYKYYDLKCTFSPKYTKSLL